MYGTVARMKVKAGQMDAFRKQMDEFNANRQPKGYRGDLIFQMDADSNEIMMIAMFDNKDNYHANANDPEQDNEYQKMRALLDADPEWNDGEMIHQFWKQ